MSGHDIARFIEALQTFLKNLSARRQILMFKCIILSFLILRKKSQSLSYLNCGFALNLKKAPHFLELTLLSNFFAKMRYEVIATNQSFPLNE